MRKETKVTEFGEQLKQALDNQTPELVWKDEKGKSFKLSEMTPQQLQKAYNHICDMLWNTSPRFPGKYHVRENIKALIEDCNATLLMRYLIHDLDIEVFQNNLQLLEFIRTQKKERGVKESEYVTSLFDGLPNEFKTVTVGKLINACFDKLGVINRKMLNNSFILSQGIWLTNEEKDELTEFDENHQRKPWPQVIKERLMLPDVSFRITPKGFSYNELRAILHLELFTKISDLPSDSVRLFRDKIFLMLDADNDWHIDKWETLRKELEDEASSRDITLKVKIYK